MDDDYDHIYTLARLLAIESAFKEYPEVQSAKRFDCEFGWTGLIVKYAYHQDIIPLEWKPVKNVKNKFYVRIFESDEIINVVGV
jgi:hypothetical protein|tara:strand:- start:695 stop:946 length:252 start_codon:yes stop_codon:yes gene_type:complete